MIAALLHLRIGERWGLRDYGIEQLFGGDNNCEHDFGIIHRRAGDKSGPHGPGSILGPTKHAQHDVRMGEPTKTCSKCQAWKGQLGLEPTPEMYIEHLTEIFNEAKRVLKKEGTLWLNIGDTYTSTAQGTYNAPSRNIHSGEASMARANYRPFTGLQSKSLCMIPERLAWSLIQNGWILRNKIVWYKPNAMPSSVADRFSNRWEYLFMFSRSQRYYFDLDAVREAHQYPLDVARRIRQDKMEGVEPFKKGTSICRHTKIPNHQAESFGSPRARYNREGNEDIDSINPLGKNPGDVFEINTQPFPEAHFAVFPEKLCEKPIRAGCPEKVCPKCGKAVE